MRLVPLLALVALAPAPRAQGTPDPTPPEAYYPLHVGDVWEYRAEAFGPPNPTPYTRVRVVRDSTINGDTYAVLRGVRYRADGTEAETFTNMTRFDEDTARPVYWRGNGDEPDFFVCPFDLPFPSPGQPLSCGTATLVSGGLGETVSVGGEAVTTAVRVFDSVAGGSTYAAGLGSVGSIGEGSGIVSELVYAWIDGVEYGGHIPGLPNVPDPTPPESYYPLAVGNEWQYEDCGREGSSDCNVLHEYVRRTVERDTVVAGARYFVEVERRYTTASVPLDRSERLLRFSGPTLVRRDGAADVPVSCPLDADFDSEVACALFGSTARVFPQGASPSVPGGFVQAGKAYETSSDSWEGYTAGVGLVGTQFWTSPFTLRYARVGGEVVFGSVLVADETGAPTAAVLTLRASPNPTAGPLAFTVTAPAPQTVAVEAFDALGRRVWHTSVVLAGGAQTVNVDASAWAPGVYVVRATAGREAATARVVRR